MTITTTTKKALRVEPLTCEGCGQPADPSPAVLAAGGMHPRCRFGGGALTASAATAVDLDALAVAKWSIRRHGERNRRGRR